MTHNFHQLISFREHISSFIGFENNINWEVKMYVVMTTVQCKPNSINKVRHLFEETNPDLVQGQEDWVRAYFTADYETNHVTVLALWKSSNSYREFSMSDSFRQVMVQFTPYFKSQPNVTINKVLFEM
jgi:heme-degrading monooxygenase HmoA